MSQGLQTTFVVLAALAVGLMLAWTIMMLVFILMFKKFCERTIGMVEKTSSNVEPVLEAARELLVDARGKINVITSNIGDISSMTKNQVAKIDEFLKDATERAQLQLIRIDQLVHTVIGRVDKTMDAVQLGILAPVREISAVVAGVRSSLTHLFGSRRRRTVEPVTQDEELFI